LGLDVSFSSVASDTYNSYIFRRIIMTPVIPALKLSEHFTIDESVYSDKAIELGLNNNPRDVLWVMEKTAGSHGACTGSTWNKSIHVNSFYRSPAVQCAVGSKSTPNIFLEKL